MRLNLIVFKWQKYASNINKMFNMYVYVFCIRQSIFDCIALYITS